MNAESLTTAELNICQHSAAYTVATYKSPLSLQSYIHGATKNLRGLAVIDLAFLAVEFFLPNDRIGLALERLALGLGLGLHAGFSAGNTDFTPSVLPKMPTFLARLLRLGLML